MLVCVGLCCVGLLLAWFAAVDLGAAVVEINVNMVPRSRGGSTRALAFAMAGDAVRSVRRSGGEIVGCTSSVDGLGGDDGASLQSPYRFGYRTCKCSIVQLHPLLPHLRNATTKLVYGVGTSYNFTTAVASGSSSP